MTRRWKDIWSQQPADTRKIDIVTIKNARYNSKSGILFSRSVVPVAEDLLTWHCLLTLKTKYMPLLLLNFLPTLKLEKELNHKMPDIFVNNKSISHSLWTSMLSRTLWSFFSFCSPSSSYSLTKLLQSSLHQQSFSTLSLANQSRKKKATIPHTPTSHYT